MTLEMKSSLKQVSCLVSLKWAYGGSVDPRGKNKRVTHVGEPQGSHKIVEPIKRSTEH